jgi:ABC-type transport system involved in multi-copper enzyme maturation permease subunit
MVFAAFALPLLSARGATVVSSDYWLIQEMLTSLQGWGLVYPLLACVVGLLLALTTWSADHQGKHIYALSLPVPRWNYVLLRFGAGAMLLAAPALALWLGALVATAATTLPPGLRAYPTILALRFGLATFVAYGIFFAISAGTSKTAGYVLGAIGGLVLIQLGADALGLEVQILKPLLLRLVLWPGPFEIFTGRWMLFDV